MTDSRSYISKKKPPTKRAQDWQLKARAPREKDGLLGGWKRKCVNGTKVEINDLGVVLDGLREVIGNTNLVVRDLVNNYHRLKKADHY